MKLTRSAVNIRETFVHNLFRYNPKLTGAEAMRTIQEYFGVGMSPNRVYAIRKEIVNNKSAPTLTIPVPKATPVPKPTTIAKTMASIVTELPEALVKQFMPELSTEGKHVYLLMV